MSRIKHVKTNFHADALCIDSWLNMVVVPFFRACEDAQERPSLSFLLCRLLPLSDLDIYVYRPRFLPTSHPSRCAFTSHSLFIFLDNITTIY